MGTFIECSAVVFDVDGTLIDSTPVVERIWRSWSAGRTRPPAVAA